jgi:hypothetical protein
MPWVKVIPLLGPRGVGYGRRFPGLPGKRTEDVVATHGRSITAALSGLAACMLAPAAASGAGLIAAYDRYEAGKGFEIALVDVGRGTPVVLPAGVNTPADELHPTLSADGRFLAFARMTLLPKLNGDIVPPPERTVHWADLQTGQITAVGAGSGPVLTARTPTSSTLTWGVPPETSQPSPATREGSAAVALLSAAGAVAPSRGSAGAVNASVDTRDLYVPHAASIPNRLTETVFTPACQPCEATRDARYLSLAYHDPVTGAVTKSTARLSLFGIIGGVSDLPQTHRVLEFGAPGAPAGHPVPRSGDGYVALDVASGEDVDIHSITYPGETQTSAAPVPITTAAPERMPAWSPDGLALGFVRTEGGRRKLGVFDSTPGLQTIVNPLVDLGLDAPTPQTRAFQSVWGGLSLATAPAALAPVVACAQVCLANLQAATLASPVRLTPTVSTSRKTQRIGIFVARVTGTRKLLGRTVARIRVVGRVPLGATRKGTNRFRWNGRVAGKRLRAGTYLMTYRALQDERVLSTSGSIRFTVGAGGKLRGVRRER